MFGKSQARRPGTTKGQHSFAQIPKAEIQRSVLDRSCGYKTAFHAAELIPIYIDEALPGDTFNVKVELFARLATLLSPIMDNLYLDVQFFAVPNRLLWENWEKFNGAQDSPGDSTDFLVPTMEQGLTKPQIEDTLHDYMGIPLDSKGTQISALFHRAYNRVWNDWYRDQNLQNPVVQNIDDGPDTIGDYSTLNRGKRHDYFTSCLPWPQKGDAVDLPLGTSAPVIEIAPNTAPTFKTSGAAPVTGRFLEGNTGNTSTLWDSNFESDEAAEWDTPGLIADLTNATAATINSLRQAFQIQKMFERDARGGTRYVELLKSHFGVTSPDFRLQRSEYLGGGSTAILISPIPSTSASGTPNVGDLAAQGTASGSMSFMKSFTEHCVIIGLMSVRADLNYQQGLERMWSRQTRFDYFWPALSHIGEQAVLNKEIYCQGTAGGTDDDNVFGYQERWAEYRYKPSLVTGQMRSQNSVPLDIWHLAQDFSALPVLGDTFIKDNPPVSRVLADQDAIHFIFDSHFKARVARPMPTYSVPGLIDHF